MTKYTISVKLFIIKSSYIKVKKCDQLIIALFSMSIAQSCTVQFLLTLHPVVIVSGRSVIELEPVLRV